MTKLFKKSSIFLELFKLGVLILAILKYTQSCRLKYNNGIRMSSTDSEHKKKFENRTFFIVKGKNDKDNTEYFQLNEEDTYKPTPALFICREVGKTNLTASMHFEGLPYTALKWFLEYVENAWDTELDDTNMV